MTTNLRSYQNYFHVIYIHSFAVLFNHKICFLFQVKFKLEALDGNIQKSEVRVEVVGPSSKPLVTLNWQGMTGYGEFTPAEPGPHKVSNQMKLLIYLILFVLTMKNQKELGEDLNDTIALNSPFILNILYFK